MDRRIVAAVDIGASGGRVIAGIVEDGTLRLHPVHRFPNGVVELDDHLRWDIDALFGEVIAGLRLLVEAYPEVESIGVDTWAVDYGLLDDDGVLLEPPISYRDGRPAGAIAEVHARVGPSDLFRINGLQFLPFNTLYQLAADRHREVWGRARHVALLPDLIGYWLTGELRTEYTNATTTGLVDVRTGDWSAELLARLDLPPNRLPAVVQPGTTRGMLLGSVAARIGLPHAIPVISVGSHDTASAVVGTPLRASGAAYIASGTWSLVGLELPAPVLSDECRAAGATNEGGVDGTIRLLRNVGGLWLLQESLRTWSEEGRTHALEELLREAAALAGGPGLFDVDAPEFIAPGGMPGRIEAALRAGGCRAVMTPAAVTRAILDSLANAYAWTVQALGTVADRPVGRIHLVGGGAQNELLCQLTATASGLPVIAGPVEATAAGNVLVQARAIGALHGGLAELRELVARSFDLRTYEP